MSIASKYIRDVEGLSDTLSQVFFFVEEVNSAGAHWIGKHARLFEHEEEDKVANSRKVRTLQQPHLKEFILDLSRNIICNDWSRLNMTRGISLSGSRPSEFTRLALKAGVVPVFNPNLVERLVKILLRPALTSLDEGGNWKIRGVPHLQRLPLPQRLAEVLYAYKIEGSYNFSTRRVFSRKSIPLSESWILYWEEALDPISVLREFLITDSGEDIESVDHYIQTWLKHVFCLSYEKSLKYILSGVSKRFNELCFGSSTIHENFRLDKSATLTTSLLIEEIVDALEGRDSGLTDSRQETLRKALGVYLFLRFCRQLRCRYFWLRSDLKIRGKEESNPEQYKEIVAGLRGRQCVSALRPLEYTYLQTRMFGALSSVPGFNFIFRGGFLPRTDSGRTFTIIGPPGAGKTVFALQMMTDVARVGRLALYLSFEESYDAIVDRMVAFGLYDPSRFEVLSVGDDIGLQIRERAKRSDRRGLLLLYSIHPDGTVSDISQRRTYDLLDVIGLVGREAGDDWRWRALAVDSINALRLTTEAQTVSRRINLQRLIEAIEANKFLGIVLSEKGDKEFEVLSYLSDTVVELGSDNPSLTRWIEIKKCRNQDYQPGPHTFRIMDARGLSIYPSLSSRMSSLRRRVRSTLSERRIIPFPSQWEKSLDVPGIKEKSSTLIWGGAGSGKTLFLIQLATEPSGAIEDGRFVLPEKSFGPPLNVLLVTFRTSELNFLQSLRSYEDLSKRWNRVKKTRVRWYSPGENLTGAEIINDLWRYVRESRREGVPLDRLLFDETEVAEKFLPTLQRESLFWPTVLELASTEAITSFFVSGTEDGRSRIADMLGSSMDYVLHLRRESDKAYLEVQRDPSWAKERGGSVELKSNLVTEA